MDWTNNAETVQDIWNDFETKLIRVIDSVVPLRETNNELFSSKISPSVRNKLNSRNRLLKIFKDRPTLELKRRIKNLNIEIRNYFFSEKRNNVRHKIIPGNCKSLWNAVNAAYDNGTTSLPECMTLGGVGVDVHERSDCFAKHFEQKVKTITENVTVTGQVYNSVLYNLSSCSVILSTLRKGGH